MHPTHAPLRLATGAYILNSGLGKLKGTEAESEHMHGWASSVYPFLGDIDPKKFGKYLGYGEVALGAALLLPTVSSAVAGSALAAFGAGLVGLYLKTPGMTQEDGIRPTEDGLAVAKDVWLAGAGLTLAAQSFLSGTKHAARSVAGGVTGAAGSVASGVSGAASSAASGVAGAFGSGGSSAQKGVKGLLSGAQDARADLADALADLAEAMTKR